MMLFAGDHVACLSVGAAFTAAAIILSRIPFKMFVKSVKPLMPFLILTAVLNLFFIGSGEVYFQWKFIKLTSDGIEVSIFMLIRITLLIMGSSLLTYTTSPITLTDAIERLLSPLKKLKVPVHELAMMMSIALRFIPTLIEETDKIMAAQKARGAEIDSGSFMTRARNMIAILVPLFISAFRRADELALAMECRCYQGGDGRTKMKLLRFHRNDFVTLLLGIVLTAGVIVLANFGL